MGKKYLVLLILFVSILYNNTNAQELQAKVTVLSQQIGSTVNKNVFTTLQTQLTNFLNSRKWTKDVFQPQEKLQCNFLLNLQSVTDDNIYKAALTVQVGRPVYNASYQSPLVNYQDVDLTFKYQEFQPIEFNESRVSGSEPLVGNLTAVFAYYVYIILGLDYDSFSAKGGEEYFKKAQNIVTNAPEDKSITGWKIFDGVRNRYWLANNLNNTKFNQLHDIFYGYYRTGLDMLYSDQATARINVLNVLNQWQDFNQENPNTMILQFFLQGRSDEIIGIFKKADPSTKSKAIEALSKIDISNAAKYRAELK